METFVSVLLTFVSVLLTMELRGTQQMTVPNNHSARRVNLSSDYPNRKDRWINPKRQLVSRNVYLFFQMITRDREMINKVNKMDIRWNQLNTWDSKTEMPCDHTVVACSKTESDFSKMKIVMYNELLRIIKKEGRFCGWRGELEVKTVEWIQETTLWHYLKLTGWFLSMNKFWITIVYFTISLIPIQSHRIGVTCSEILSED